MALVVLALVLLCSRKHVAIVDPELLDPSRLTSADHQFLSRFNLYLTKGSPQEKPDHAIANQWMELVTSWAQSSRFLSFRDVLKTLPPPATWRELQEAGAKSLPGLTLRQAATVRIATALLNDDRSAENRSFDDLLLLLEKGHPTPTGPLVIELFRLWECLYAEQTDGAGAPRLTRLLGLASTCGYSPTRPFEEIYIPNLAGLGNRADDFANKILLLPTKLFLVTPNEETQRILRAASFREITQMSCLPSEWYREEPYWGEFARLAKLYAASHPNPPMDRQLPLLFSAELKSRNKKDKITERLLLQSSVSSAQDDMVSQFLIHDLAGPAYEFTASQFKKTKGQWVAHRAGLFALMSGHDRDFENMAKQYPERVALQDALIMMHLRLGNYDAAFGELSSNLTTLERQTSYQLGIDELIKQALVLDEIDDLLYGGIFLGRPDWTALGLAQARREFTAFVRRPSLSGQFRQVWFARILGSYISVGLDDEAARDLRVLEATRAPLSIQVFPEKLRLAYLQKNWAQILALAHDFTAQFAFAQNTELRPSVAGDLPTAASLILAQAQAASGHPERAVAYLRGELLAGRFSVPILTLAKSVLGVPQTIAAVGESSASEADEVLAQAFLGDPEAGKRLLNPTLLNPADLTGMDKMNLRAVAFEHLAQAAEKGNDLAAAGQFSAAARAWQQMIQTPLLYEKNFYGKMIQDEEQATSLSKSPLVSFKLALELELAGRKVEAAHYYAQSFAPPASNQAGANENPSSAWLESIPMLTPVACAEIDNLEHRSSSPATAFTSCLIGLAAYQSDDSQRALASFQTALRLEPQNPVACQYILKLSDRIAVPDDVAQSAMEIVLASQQRLENPPRAEFDLKRLWEATSGWPQSSVSGGRDEPFSDSRVPDLDQALKNLADHTYAHRMSAVADTAALTSCANLMDAFP